MECWKGRECDIGFFYIISFVIYVKNGRIATIVLFVVSDTLGFRNNSMV